MEGLKKLIREQPTIAAGVVRQVLLAAVLLGLHLDDAQIVAIMIAVESILSAINWVLVTPTVKVEAAVEEQVADAVQARTVGDTTNLTDAEIEMLDRQIDRLNAALNMERVKRGKGTV